MSEPKKAVSGTRVKAAHSGRSMAASAKTTDAGVITRPSTVHRVVVKNAAKRKMFAMMPTVMSLELIRRSDEATSGGVHMLGRRGR